VQNLKNMIKEGLISGVHFVFFPGVSNLGKKDNSKRHSSFCSSGLITKKNIVPDYLLRKEV